jgi:hypothetical protein
LQTSLRPDKRGGGDFGVAHAVSGYETVSYPDEPGGDDSRIAFNTYRIALLADQTTG